MKVKIKKLHVDAVIPKYAKDGDAAMDLVAVSFIETNEKLIYDTGLAFEIPEGYVGLVYSRSSVIKTSLRLANCVGIIDSSYRGSVKLVFDHCCSGGQYKVGDRIGQIMIMPYPQIEFEEVDELSETDRGVGGFGSTGKASY
jgi:dUTP pyrophosphatase